MLRRSLLYLRTLPHLRPWQIVGRVVAPLRNRLVSIPEIPDRLAGKLDPRVPFLYHEPWNKREDILRGRFRFLNHSEDLGWPVKWKAPQSTLLWQFNLHYFHYLHLLQQSEQVALCRSWVAENASTDIVSWHPYPTSHRIVNWCKANLDDPSILGSLYRQAAYLLRNRETYVYGNHLIENARALIFAGRFFGGAGEAKQWLDKGLKILRYEANQQILSDGGHFERSPMYHALVLEAYADVLNVLDLDDPNRRWIADIVESMMRALDAMTHPDGRIALLNDSTFEIAPRSEDLRSYATRLGLADSQAKNDLPETGYYIYDSDDIYLIIDAGPGGPDYLMAHAHADIFSFELSISGTRFVVDTGVFEYAEGKKRQLARSTAAHNTVSIDETDQFECWGSFRVARRFAPHSISIERDGVKTTFAGTFPGYACLIGDDVVHSRTVIVDEDERAIRVRDAVSGRGSHLVESRIHLHPDVRASDSDPQQLTRSGRTCRLDVTRGQMRWEESTYFPRFGVESQRKTAVLGGKVALPIEFEYAIRY